MLIGERLRALREARGLSQGDIEEATGLIRCYVSRVENDHITPTIETLEKFARALDIPLYAIFYHGPKRAEPAMVPKPMQLLKSRADVRFMKRLARSLSRMEERDRRLLLQTAVKLASGKKARAAQTSGPPERIARKASCESFS